MVIRGKLSRQPQGEMSAATFPGPPPFSLQRAHRGLKKIQVAGSRTRIHTQLWLIPKPILSI